MSTYLGQFTGFCFVSFLWAPLPCSVLDYPPDFLLFLLFSHSITSILSSYSLPKGSHLFPGVEYLLDADDSLSSTPAWPVSLGPHLHSQLPPRYLYLLPHRDLRHHRSKMDLSVFFVNFQIYIPLPFLPSPPVFPVSLSLLSTHCSGQTPDHHL